ncbi:helix-turn-helix domain-containing protein [Nocardia altamirensis]|uniref:helix-turn-helix domain-containing protein n=1 Tax=Nocardia altamirensis TaxID=472158 RepID=UPI00084027ED|nr:helix-turn-helix transcriptional regulator [Nocardia altamirensis]
MEGEVLEFGEWSKFRQRKKFAGRLNQLFATVHPPWRKPHTNGEVAAALTADGHPISTTYLAQLRSGTRSTPSGETVAALAKFFKVDPDYFYNDIYAAKIDHDLVLLTQLQATGLRRLSSRAFDLSEESQNLLTAMAEKLRASEGLPEIPPDGTEWRKSTR